MLLDSAQPNDSIYTFPEIKPHCGILGMCDRQLFFHFIKYQVPYKNNMPIMIIQCIRCHIPSLVWIEQRMGEIFEVTERWYQDSIALRWHHQRSWLELKAIWWSYAVFPSRKLPIMLCYEYLFLLVLRLSLTILKPKGSLSQKKVISPTLLFYQSL